MAIAVWRGRMKTRSKSDTWRWRRPTAWGLAILCVLTIIEGIIIYCDFASDDQGMFSLASLLVGSLLVICASILLTEKSSA